MYITSLSLKNLKNANALCSKIKPRIMNQATLPVSCKPMPGREQSSLGKEFQQRKSSYSAMPSGVTAAACEETHQNGGCNLISALSGSKKTSQLHA